MADVYEQNLASKSTLTTTDYIRVVGSDNVSYKQLVSDVAKKIIENYTGSTLAGSAQSVKSALDSLNSKMGTAVAAGSSVLDVQTTSFLVVSPQATDIPLAGFGFIGCMVYSSSSFAFIVLSAYSTGRLFYAYKKSDGSWAAWKEFTLV